MTFGPTFGSVTNFQPDSPKDCRIQSGVTPCLINTMSGSVAFAICPASPSVRPSCVETPRGIEKKNPSQVRFFASYRLTPTPSRYLGGLESHAALWFDCSLRARKPRALRSPQTLYFLTGVMGKTRLICLPPARLEM